MNSAILWTVLTLINICGGCTAIVVALITQKRYVLPHRMGRYVNLRCIGMVMLIWGQLMTLTQSGYWPLKITSVYWWGTFLYFSFLIRFSSLRKDASQKDIKFTNQKRKL